MAVSSGTIRSPGISAPCRHVAVWHRCAGFGSVMDPTSSLQRNPPSDSPWHHRTITQMYQDREERKGSLRTWDHDGVVVTDDGGPPDLFDTIGRNLVAQQLRIGVGAQGGQMQVRVGDE